MVKKGSLLPTTKVLLQLLAQAGEAGVDFYNMLYDLKYHRGWYIAGGPAYVLEMKKLQQKKYAKQALDQLKRSGYVKASYLGERLMATLTKKGRASNLLCQLRNAPQLKQGYTVVIFDIPETQQLARRRWRWFLRQAGFKKLQQSVWFSKLDNYLTLNDFIKKLKLQQWVNVFYGNNFSCPPD
ncbi:MAG: CRISPR-associated endonuclease Cas2 [Patescibacteria group bacterium]